MGSGGLPMNAIPPTRCEVCKLVVQGVWRKKLSEHGCPGSYFIAGSLLDQTGGMVPTVIVDARTMPNTSTERQALLDIQDLYTNTDEDSDNEDFIRAIWDIVKGVLNE